MKKILITMTILAVLFVPSCSKSAPNEIGVQQGTTAQYFIDGSEDWGFDGISGYKSKQYQNAGLAVQALKNNAVKYVITDRAPANALSKSISGVKVIDIPLTDEEYAFAVDKNNPELLEKINASLLKLKNNGTFDKILNAYATESGINPVVSAKKDLNNQDGQLVVATNAQFAPFEYREGDKFVGIDMEIAREIANDLGMELVLEDMEFDSIVMAIGKHGVDAGMAALTVTDTRKKSVNFSDSYYNAAQVLIVKDTDTTFDNCKTAEDVVALIK